MLQIISIVVAYLIGSFPSGILISSFYKIDVTKEGSGNIGATNIARTLGKKAGAITLLLDVLKGVLGVLVGSIVWGSSIQLLPLAIAVIAGHCFSLPKLKGGKGVATSLGALLYCSPIYALSTVLVFITTFKLSKVVSLSSVMAALSLPIVAFVYSTEPYSALSTLVISSIVTARHHANIRRLVRGQEKTFL